MISSVFVSSTAFVVAVGALAAEVTARAQPIESGHRVLRRRRVPSTTLRRIVARGDDGQLYGFRATVGGMGF